MCESYPPPPPEITEALHTAEREGTLKTTDWGSEFLLGGSLDPLQSVHPRDIHTEANSQWKKHNVEAAVELWKRALKGSLKLSVSKPDKELFDLGMTCRLNLAQAYLNLEDYESVLNQTQVVLNYDGSNPKALYRRAQAEMALGNVDMVLETCSHLLADQPENTAVQALKQKAQQAQRDTERAQDMFYKRAFDKQRARPELIEAPEALAESTDVLIAWKHDTDEALGPDSLWKQPEEMRYQKEPPRSCTLTFPFALLFALQNALFFHNKDTLGGGLRSLLHRKLVVRDTALPTGKRPLCLYVLGAHGDAEFQASWVALLERLPMVDHLRVVLIGFMDDDDRIGSRLAPHTLSPPLCKPVQGSQHRKVKVQMFKGSFQEFVAIQTALERRKRDEPVKEGLLDLLTDFPPAGSVLNDPQWDLYPDIVFVSHPDVSGHFASWVPAFSYLLARGIFTVFGLLSSKKSINYEAIQIPALMDFLGAAVVIPPIRCPYAAIPIQPLEKPLFSHYEGDHAILEVTSDTLARNERKRRDRA
ncbi:MAG: uncharacterized protein KVP18_002109 [Porospora cf. gigantea A]|uniref:uncharacterized protein n=1 Tax=Porospora cf. gigantea A TaxID=2853593 RepID=UPI00355A5764|nr:MAG: hypothetical protein KVP18_002109 [Porospora cf. gigantea A]